MSKKLDPFSAPWRSRRSELVRRFVIPGEMADDIGESFVALTYQASADEQWDLILELIAAAPDNDEVLGRIAAGPLEGLLGKHGARVIARIEALADRDMKFRRILTGVWQHEMPDEIWMRVCRARAGRN